MTFPGFQDKHVYFSKIHAAIFSRFSRTFVQITDFSDSNSEVRVNAKLFVGKVCWNKQQGETAFFCTAALLRSFFFFFFLNKD